MIRWLDTLVVASGYWALAMLAVVPSFVIVVGILVTAKLSQTAWRLVHG